MFTTGDSDANTPWVIRVLLKAGFRNRKQAEAVLVVFAALCILASFWMSVSFETPLPNDVQQNPNYEPTQEL